jgi:amino acid adenylation domain-containing protein/non-ribosomal peptide synthase protein (TIGR01720 family)
MSYRMSPQQRRLWSLNHESAGRAAQYVVELDGPLQEKRLRDALRRVVGRHEILRTSYRLASEAGVQFVSESADAAWRTVDVSDLDAARRADKVAELARRERERAPDAERETSLSALLIGFAPEQYTLILTLDALCADALALDNLCAELAGAYDGGPDESEEPLQYAAFAEWQNELLEEEAEAWRGPALASALSASLPFAGRAENESGLDDEGGAREASFEFAFDEAETGRFESAAEALGATPEQFMLACWESLLWRLAPRPEIVVGLVCDGRKFEELRGAIGIFAKTVPVACHFNEGTSFVEVLRQTQRAAEDAYEYQEYFNWDDEPAAGANGAGPAGFPFAFEYTRWPSPRMSGGVSFAARSLRARVDRVGIKLNCARRAGALECELEYDSATYRASDISRLAGQLSMLVSGAVATPETPVTELDLLDEEELLESLAARHCARVAYPRDRCFHELFEEQAARTPDRVAAVFEDASLSYGELNARANQLARHLRRLGVGPEILVGLMIRRSLDMLIAILGALKAGGAYVPLDLSYPPKRLGFMLEDARVSLVLTERALADRLPAGETPRLLLDEAWDDVSVESRANLIATSAGEHLVYVIYTSGSTGKPKGVMAPQRSLVNYLSWATEAYAVNAGRGALVHSPLGFDLTVTGLFPPLIAGACVALAPEGQGLDALPASLRANAGLSLVKITPAHLDLLAAMTPPGENASALTDALVVGGEALHAESLAFWRERAPATRIFNEYGPTETVVGCCVHEITERDARAGAVAIGRPIANTEMYTLDARLRPAVAGVTGEIYIGGDGVTRGYLNRPELTAERFIPNSFSEEPGARLYRTGDLGRFEHDGELECLGRVDRQVKVRGYRVELGEIEAALKEHAEVREAVVARAEENKDERLVAYLVMENGRRPTVNELRRHAESRLPTYMTPAIFVTLERLPLTPNGKIDRRALPAPDHARPDLEESFAPARGEAEEALARIWRQVLGVEQVGVHDNFFRLGGDSILSIQIVARANQAGIRITPQQLFEHQTVAKLAAVATRASSRAAESETVTGRVELTPIQRWFFDLDLPAPHHFNQSLLFTMTRRVDPAALARAASILVEHHDMLRATFRRSPDGGWTQEVAARGAGREPFTLVDLSDATDADAPSAIERECERIQSGFDLATGPLLTLALIDCGAERPQRLLLVAHHLVIDGVSWRILLEDLQSTRVALESGEDPLLPAKTCSFRRWAESLAERARGPEVEAETAYWSKVGVASRPLPRDFSGDNTVESARSLTLTLDAERTQSLLRRAPAAYGASAEEALLCAVGEALRRWTGARAALVEVEGHGREEFGAGVDVSRTVGWFTTNYPVELEDASRFEAGEALRRAKETVRGVPARGIGYGLLKYMRGERPRLGDGIVAEVSFNYLGQLDRALEGETLLSPSAESGGRPRDPRGRRGHLLQITASVSGGRLRLTWGYSEGVHRRETIERVAGEALGVLEEVVDHCAARESRRYTPSDFPLAGLDQTSLDRMLAGVGAVEDIYPLSPLQQGILFHATREPESGAYFEQVCLLLEGALDFKAFDRAWVELLRRHMALRTAFIWDMREHPLQFASPRVEIDWATDDWRGAPPEELRERLAAFMRAGRESGFDLSRPPLMRLALIRIGEDAHYFVWSFHHLLLDGWSKNLLLNEFSALYESYEAGEEIALPQPASYREYIAWLRRQDRSSAEAFWRERLRGFTSPILLGGESARAAALDRRADGGEQFERLSPETSAALEALARERGLTLNTIMQGAWALLLSHYSGEEDVVFGTVVSGRPADLSGVETMVGLFINTAPARLRVTSEAPLLDWLKDFQAQQAEARRYEYTPLAEVQSWSEAPRGQLLFESIFVFENYPVETAPREAKSSLRATHLPSAELTSFPLTVVVGPGAEIVIKMVYDASRFDETFIAGMLRRFRALLEAAYANADGMISSLSSLAEDESADLIRGFTEDLNVY